MQNEIILKLCEDRPIPNIGLKHNTHLEGTEHIQARFNPHNHAQKIPFIYTIHCKNNVFILLAIQLGLAKTCCMQTQTHGCSSPLMRHFKLKFTMPQKQTRRNIF